MGCSQCLLEGGREVYFGALSSRELGNGWVDMVRFQMGRAFDGRFGVLMVRPLYDEEYRDWDSVHLWRQADQRDDYLVSK